MSDVTIYVFFFFNDTATTEIYTLSLHDALPISARPAPAPGVAVRRLGRDVGAELEDGGVELFLDAGQGEDRKSTRLNSSHANISYAVFCLKKKKNQQSHQLQ